MTIKSPMLAKDYVAEALRFPVLCSYKLDGYRAFVDGGYILTRSGKAIPNKFTFDLFSSPEFEGFDGELIVGAPNDKRAFDNTSGPIRRASGEPDVCWYVFDDRTAEGGFAERFARLQHRLTILRRYMPPSVMDRIKLVHHERLGNIEELDQMEEVAQVSGYEGLMIRKPNGPYKFGRSTVAEGYLLKVKRRVRTEAKIIGYVELMHNDNEAYANEVGKTKRSEDAEGLRPSGMIGSFIVEDADWPRPFKIGAGNMTHDQRRHALANFEAEYKGQMASFSYLPHGEREVPREGIFHGLRGPEDMGSPESAEK
jgi:DNA ligase 1